MLSNPGNNYLQSHESTGSKKPIAQPNEATNKDQAGAKGGRGAAPINLAAIWPQFSLDIKELVEDVFISNAREDKKKALVKNLADIRQQEINKKVSTYILYIAKSR